MHRCAFLTLSDPTGFVIDDERAYDAFAERGWEVSAVPWDRTPVAWSSFDAVIIRSTWDYQHRLDRFLAVLEEIEGQGIPLFNALGLVRWNVQKSYLNDLARSGVPVVPTVFLDRLAPDDVRGLSDRLDSDEVVLKPLVSGNAEGAFRLAADPSRARVEEVAAYYAERPLLAQPFVRAIVDEGEFSLFYFDGAYSHAILKTPAGRDYRVQEEHGGRITAVHPTPALLETGAAALGALPRTPLYARVDLVRANSGEGFWLMELELVEPSLYLRMDADAPQRFAGAFVRSVTDSHPAAPS
jgi:hypothetical protein